MLHFPSTLRSNASSNGLPTRTDSLNATQQKSGSNPVFLKIEEELHDARRVKAHGQEEDLRLALDMVINRVTEVSSLLAEAYKTQADLEVQLNVAKSNLALVIANNEMLEDALKRDTPGSSREVGWRRRSGKDGDVSSGERERQSLEEWQQVPALDYLSQPPTPTPDSQSNSAVNSPRIPSQVPTPNTSAVQIQEASRFFKFRFASSSTSSRFPSRPSTPSGGINAPSPQLPPQGVSPIYPPVPAHITKELEDLSSELRKERSARKAAEQEKTNLEAELESLSQALFEEANKMVATERIKLAETEEELGILRTEKEALRRALKLIEGENNTLRQSAPPEKPSPLTPHSQHLEQGNLDESDYDRVSPIPINRSRSSSEVAIKSRPSSLILESTVPLPPSPAPELDSPHHNHDQLPSPSPLETASSNDSQRTPKNLPSASLPFPPLTPSISSPYISHFESQPSPWADVPSLSNQSSTAPPSSEVDSGALYGAALAMR